MVVLAREESSDMSLGEVSVLASALLRELVALLLAILTGVLAATLMELMKSDLNLSNSYYMLSLTALIRGERMVLRSAGMTLLEVVGMLVMSSGGSIMDTRDRTHRLVSLYTLNLLVEEVTGLVDLIWGLAKVCMLVSPLALFPGVPMVEFKSPLEP